jgi:hypothetical protein
VLSLRDEDKRGFGQNVFPLAAFAFFSYIISFDLYEREEKVSAQAKLTYIKERL